VEVTLWRCDGRVRNGEGFEFCGKVEENKKKNRKKYHERENDKEKKFVQRRR